MVDHSTFQQEWWRCARSRNILWSMTMVLAAAYIVYMADNMAYLTVYLLFRCAICAIRAMLEVRPSSF